MNDIDLASSVLDIVVQVKDTSIVLAALIPNHEDIECAVSKFLHHAFPLFRGESITVQTTNDIFLESRIRTRWRRSHIDMRMSVIPHCIALLWRKHRIPAVVFSLCRSHSCARYLLREGDQIIDVKLCGVLRIAANESMPSNLGRELVNEAHLFLPCDTGENNGCLILAGIIVIQIQSRFPIRKDHGIKPLCDIFHDLFLHSLRDTNRLAHFLLPPSLMLLSSHVPSDT